MSVGNERFFPALFLALLSGVAGLAHQVVWTRRLVDILGANADTFSKVVGTFFAGLALGAWWSGRTKASSTTGWRRVAWAELAVAACAVPMLLSGELANWIYAHTSLGRVSKFLLPLLLVLPPATAMGLVIPWMIRALAMHPSFKSQHAVWIYAINTLGGVLGVGLVVLEALPGLGLSGAGVSAITLNLLVAAGALWLHRSGLNGNSEAAELTGPRSAPFPAIRKMGRPQILAFASGFLILALEVILQTQMAQVMVNSLFSSALILGLVLTSLALAAVLMPWLVRVMRSDERALVVALLAASLICATQPLLFTTLRDGLNILPYELPPGPYLWEAFKLGLVVICPIFVAGGCIFPLLLRQTAADSGGRKVGPLLAWNGLGGWLGAEVAQAWLAPTLGLWGSAVGLGALYGALLIWICFQHERIPMLGRAGAIAVVVTIHPFCAWQVQKRPQASVALNERLAALAVGREGVVATLEVGPGDWRMLFNNSYTLGGSKAQFNQERQGLLPSLLHGHPTSVATLGVATGGTVAGVALHPQVERIDAIELSPLVLGYARDFFGPYNRLIFADPRIRFVQEDARWVIAGQPATYDVVVGDLFLPWRTGEARLFTREHFQNVRRSLRPDGVFCQWLPMFQLTRPQFEAIARTFQDVFPDAFLVRGDFYAELPILGLVGGRKFTSLDWSGIERTCQRLRAENKSRDPLVRAADGVAMMMLGPLPPPGEGPRNTMANSWVEWDAGRNILGLRTPWFIGVPWAEYVRAVQRAGQSMLPLHLRGAQEAGQFFLTLEIAAKLQVPQFADLRAQAWARLPSAVRTDDPADWLQWPSRVKVEQARPR